MASILKSAKNYQRIPRQMLAQERHLYDPYTPPPRILKPEANQQNTKKSPDDISTFPK